MDGARQEECFGRSSIGCPVHIEKFNGKEVSTSVRPPRNSSGSSSDGMGCNVLRLHSKSLRGKCAEDYLDPRF